MNRNSSSSQAADSGSEDSGDGCRQLQNHNYLLPENLEGFSIYMVGIKGTGMTALAELFTAEKADVIGSDVEEVFYTDAVLKEIGVPVLTGFHGEHIEGGREKSSAAGRRKPDIVIYSAAYDPEDNPELSRAKELGIPRISYPEALGILSARFDSSAVAGVHGKTTTTALAGELLRALDLPATILAGSAVSSFAGRSTLRLGSKYFIAETCEYRRNFLHFHPHRIILTSVEADHLDYYRDYDDIRSAFLSFLDRLPAGGTVIYCADDGGAVETVDSIAGKRPDLRLLPYGFAATGPYRVMDYRVEDERSLFRLAGWDRTLSLRVPGKHSVLNAAAAVALTLELSLEQSGGENPNGLQMDAIEEGLKHFSGSKRRSEIIGEAGGIIFMDDYAHHPTAIRTTLEGIRRFFPDRRLVVDFMSHTYSRTAALIDEFADSFGEADLLILHDIYASAREEAGGDVNGETLYRKVRAHHRDVHYFPAVMDSLVFCREQLQEGDLFLTMGAGDNWKLGRELYKETSENGRI
ncbi:MAG: UDP-N-acetylmuramate--L-alanine ligase [Spirochaetales bacterium]|nr:UDP-N-acetylmuramate--L-alanine ligase [Spirochaetales bacterium]MCF7937130.1 UDP-N-acetylmuramate--L-alanine ligase [Spirochaetales bacterium]